MFRNLRNFRWITLLTWVTVVRISWRLRLNILHLCLNSSSIHHLLRNLTLFHVAEIGFCFTIYTNSAIFIVSVALSPESLLVMDARNSKGGESSAPPMVILLIHFFCFHFQKEKKVFFFSPVILKAINDFCFWICVKGKWDLDEEWSSRYSTIVYISASSAWGR